MIVSSARNACATRRCCQRYRTLDIATEEGKQKIIDTFVNAVYAFDDHFKIIYNTNGKEETVTLEELSCSNDISRGEPTKSRPQPRSAFRSLPCWVGGVATDCSDHREEQVKAPGAFLENHL